MKWQLSVYSLGFYLISIIDDISNKDNSVFTRLGTVNIVGRHYLV